MFLQLHGKLMENIAITTQSLKMLNTQKSWDPKLKMPREVLTLSYCIIYITQFFFWNGFYVKCILSVLLSNIAVGISLYEILYCISPQSFLYIYSFYRHKKCICGMCSNTWSRNMNAQTNRSFHTAIVGITLVGKKNWYLFKWRTSNSS